jgi:hypothetical protein
MVGGAAEEFVVNFPSITIAAGNAASMPVLFSTHTQPGYMDPPVLSPGQVVCGPERPDRDYRGLVTSLKTPLGRYDLAQQIERLPAEQRPELVVVRADATRRNRPVNLAGIKARKVLLVGDTHHRRAPIAGLIDYAKSEPFDLVLLDYTRQHAHFFVEAGVRNLHWLPGFAVDPPPPALARRPQKGLIFVGMLEAQHAQRRRMIEALMAAGLKPELFHAFGAQAPQLHAAATVSFNCSLNGDLNQRVIEVPAAGGCLLTDRLAPQAGLEILFEPGRDLELYDGPEELVERARALLADPARAAAIAAAGLARYREAYAPAATQAEFAALLEGRGGRAAHALSREPRAAKPALAEPERLAARLALYQAVQELHRREPALAMLLAGEADPDSAADLVDLPRLRVSVEPGLPAPAQAAIERLILPGQVTVAPAQQRRWDILAASPAWLAAAGGAAFLARACRALALSERPDGAATAMLASAGFTPWRDEPALHLSPELAATLNASDQAR